MPLAFIEHHAFSKEIFKNLTKGYELQCNFYSNTKIGHRCVKYEISHKLQSGFALLDNLFV